MGYSPGRLSRELHRNFTDVKRNDIHRLIITEMGHVAEEATAKAYEASDIEQYEYMATLESHTCSVCGHLDGEIFNLKDREIGVNYPLMHPRCRCTTVPYLKGLPPATERWMRDPETGKGRLIKDMTFDEWKKRYIHKLDNSKLVNKATRMPPKKHNYQWNELNAQQYNKHVVGTPEYKNYVKGRKRPISELIISSDETEKLIKKYGQHKENNLKNGIRFTHDSYIGKWADINGNLYPTMSGRISYRKGKGAHVTPMKPDYLK